LHFFASQIQSFKKLTLLIHINPAIFSPKFVISRPSVQSRPPAPYKPFETIEQHSPILKIQPFLPPYQPVTLQDKKKKVDSTNKYVKIIDKTVLFF
jgi:hypothetical protein